MNELLYTVWLSLSCTPGADSFVKLISKFSTPYNIFNADCEEIASCIGSKSRDYNSLVDKNTDKANQILKFCNDKNIGILTYFDKEFPKSLKEIKNPPILLYYRGVLPDFDNEFFVSIVGTRHLTPYGRKNTFTVANDLARAGATIVSGMAIGIDGVALAGALSAGKKTVAVLGSGIDICYPIHHKRLAREIVKLGCVITEYAPGTRPERFNFPVRNRIISGLSKATLVMEGRERSGAIITARHAKEQGRAVYAFPGNVGNASSEASNLLIKNGAKLFTSADDIVRDFENTSQGMLNPFKLSKNTEIDMYSVLRELQISCVSSEDDIFKSPRTQRRSASPRLIEEAKPEIKENIEMEQEVSSLFNKSVLALYKKIPFNSDCSVEELVDEEHNLRDVMQGVLKLEIARFVTMLPGDRVKRNI